MKHRLITILLLMLSVQVAKAQIIILETDGQRLRNEVEVETPFIPDLGVTYDQYVPLCDGLVLLLGLSSGFHCLKKRRKGR